MTKEALCELAIAAREQAYAPYSGYTVGAALLAADGHVYTGCNIENAAFTPTVCAERTAIFKAVSEGERKFTMMAVAGGKAGQPGEAFPPCGVCRQVLAEFCPPDFPILLAETGGRYTTYTLAEILPLAFTPKHVD
ncbi:MAG: cytidine deaminase [Clostridia bacterium]|nr:cytidine deaminase [Clostridia bacterium]